MSPEQHDFLRAAGIVPERHRGAGLQHPRCFNSPIVFPLRDAAFLRQAGAPLDNNLCERALKRAVLHRKNALFYRTLHGSQVGDLFMSLIHTCELADANPFDYLTQLQRHANELANPSAWMPWNYTGQNH